MSLEIKISKDDSTNLLFNNENGNFSLTSDKLDQSLQINCLWPSSDLKLENYNIYLFNNYFLSSENNIFKVILKNTNTTIGWIFPLQALLSNEHRFAEDEIFPNIAYISYIHLLLGNNRCSIIPEYVYGKEYSLYDFYDENIIIFILNNGRIQNFNIDDYLSSFGKYGYYKLDNSLRHNSISHSEDILKYYNAYKENKNIKIESIPPLYNFEYVKFLYANFNNIGHQPIIKFHYLYQVIELLIENILKEGVYNALSNYLSKGLRGNDVKEEFNELSREKRRINQLFNCIKAPNEDSLNTIKSNLMVSCNNILQDKGKDIGEALYKVRCLIFHNYAQILGKDELLIDINDWFELLIHNILLYYKSIYQTIDVDFCI